MRQWSSRKVHQVQGFLQLLYKAIGKSGMKFVEQVKEYLSNDLQGLATVQGLIWHYLSDLLADVCQQFAHSS